MVNCIAPGVIATGRIMATVIPGSIQSNRDRAELVADRPVEPEGGRQSESRGGHASQPPPRVHPH
jgi:hypothetical protein